MDKLMPNRYTEENYSELLYFYIILSVILVSGFLLRIWGIWNIDGQDEYNEVFEALRVSSGHLNFERWSKRFYLYILAFAYGIYYVTGWVFHVFHSPLDFATKIVRNLDPLLLIGRSISAIFGTASIFVTYLIGKSSFNRKVGLIASLFVCLNVVNIKFSHYAVVDITLCLTVLIAFYFIAQIYLDNRDNVRHYAWAGLFSGIAFQTKTPAIILLIPFLFSHIMRLKRRGLIQYIYSRGVCYYILSFLLGMIIGNPAILFAPHRYVKSLLGLARVYTTPINVTQSEHIGYIAYLLYFYKELGLLLSVLAFYALIRASFSKKREVELLLLGFIIPFYLLMGASKFMVFYRYMIPLMPFLYILCAKYLVQTVQDLRLRQTLSRGLLIISCSLLLIHPFLNVIRFESGISGKNTRIIAKEWVETNIPFGSKILMDSGKSLNTIGPKIAQNRKSVLRILERNREAIERKDRTRTRGLVDRNALRYYELLLKTIPEESYDITFTGFGMEVKSLDHYISDQFQYLVISKGIKERAKKQSLKERHPEIAQFYNSLDVDNRIRLIKTIGPTDTNTGPTYYIYKLPDTL